MGKLPWIQRDSPPHHREAPGQWAGRGGWGTQLMMGKPWHRSILDVAPTPAGI